MICKGSAVILNSGSPKMTVTKIDEAYDIIDCIYFSETQGKFEVISVHVDCVEEVNNIYNKPPTGILAQQLTIHKGE